MLSTLELIQPSLRIQITLAVSWHCPLAHCPMVGKFLPIPHTMRLLMAVNISARCYSAEKDISMVFFLMPHGYLSMLLSSVTNCLQLQWGTGSSLAGNIWCPDSWVLERANSKKLIHPEEPEAEFWNSISIPLDY